MALDEHLRQFAIPDLDGSKYVKGHSRSPVIGNIQRKKEEHAYSRTAKVLTAAAVATGIALLVGATYVGISKIKETDSWESYISNVRKHTQKADTLAVPQNSPRYEPAHMPSDK